MKRRLRWLFIGIAGIYLLVGYIAFPLFLQAKLPGIVNKTTQGNLEIDDVAFSPLLLELSVEGVRFKDREGEPFFTLDRGVVNLDLFSLLLGKPTVKNIRLQGPKIGIVRRSDGSFNFDWLLHLKSGDKAAKKKEESEGLPPVVLKNFEIEEGAFFFREMTKEVPFEVVLSPIGFRLVNIDTTKPEKSGDAMRFHAKIGDGGFLNIKSDIDKLTPLALHGTLDFESGKLFTEYRYLQENLNVEVADGKLHAHLAFTFDTDRLEDLRLEDIRIALEQLRIKPESEYHDVMRVGRISLDGGVCEPLRHRASLEAITIREPYLFVERDKTGGINWEHLARVAPVTEKRREAPEPETVPQNDDDWNATLGHLALHGGKVAFQDRTTSLPVTTTIDRIEFTAENISTDTREAVVYRSGMRINGEGNLSAEGELRRAPLSVSGAIGLKALPLKGFSAYISESSHLGLESGRLSAKSTFAYEKSDKAPDLRADGELKVRDIAVSDVRDGTTLFAWNELLIQPFALELFPNRLFIESVDFNGLFVNAHVDEKQNFNFADLAKERTAPRKSTSETGKSKNGNTLFPVQVVKLRIIDSGADFQDESLPLKFKTHIHDIDGTVLAIANTRSETSHVDVKGEVDRYGSASLKGSLNAADPKSFTDLDLRFRNIDLNALSGYSGKFAGYAIEQGKLFLDLNYDIRDAKMQGKNSLVIKKIKLGERLEGEEITYLPLGLAIALLEDSDGVIDIELPVEGRVDDPKFRFGQVVWNAFANLITKAAAAPFKLIGALLGVEGEKLEFIAFEPGDAHLLPPEREKLDQLAEALKKRPKLALGIEGSYDNRADTHALQLEKLKALAISRFGKKQERDELLMSEDILETLYEEKIGKEALEALQERFDKKEKEDKNAAQAYRSTLIEHLAMLQQVTGEELVSLARKRAQNVAHYLKSGDGVAGRVKVKAGAKSEAGGGDFVLSKMLLEANE
jgi:hypothetical protein